jgi:Ca-activated chloride channel family protein
LRQLPVALFALALTLLLVGFARPVVVVHGRIVSMPTVVLVVDVSGSMASDDVRPTRVLAARSLALDLIAELPSSDRIALVTFGNTARIVVPPTLDRAEIVASLPTTVTPRAGTAIGDAINTSVALVVQMAGKSGSAAVSASESAYPGAVLVLSDGGQDAGGTTPDGAAETAFVEDVPVDSVCIGTSGGRVTQSVVIDGYHTTEVFAVPSAPETLAEVSRESGGVALGFTSAAQMPSVSKEAVEAVYPHLRETVKPSMRREELSAAAGGAALVLLLGSVVLSGRWFGRLA